MNQKGSTFSALKHGKGGEWTPQTRISEQKCLPPYIYTDHLLSCFRGMHWLIGSCVPDYGSFTIMPITGKLHTRIKEIAVPFSHKEEVAKPDYYRAVLLDYHLKAEMTATARCAIMQFTIDQMECHLSF